MDDLSTAIEERRPRQNRGHELVQHALLDNIEREIEWVRRELGLQALSCVARDHDDLESAVLFIHPSEFREAGQLVKARLTPRGPLGHKKDTSAKVGERHTLHLRPR